MTGWSAVLAFSAVWAVVGVSSGWVGSRVPVRWLRRDRGPLRLTRLDSPRRYERVLAIRRWKDRLPEAGSWFGGTSKAQLLHLDRRGVEVLAVESRRAEWVHWVNVATGPTFFLWTPWGIGLVMTCFGVAVHGPFIAVQRYNRARIARRRSALGPAVGDAVVGHRWRRRLLAGSVVAAVAAVAVYVAIRPAPIRAVTLAEAQERVAVRDGSTGAAAGTLRPAAGVYRYEGSGTEGLDRPPVSQPQGPSMPGTVTWTDGGCWTFRIDYSSKHHQSWDFCPRGGDLVELGGESWQLLDIAVTDVEVQSRTRCPGTTRAIVGSAEPGEGERQRCEARSTGADAPVVAEGTNTFVRAHKRRIGDRRLRTLHYRRARTLTGPQDGTEVVDWWFDAATGLPVRNSRSVELRTGSPLGTLTYRERGSFDLADPSPAG